MASKDTKDVQIFEIFLQKQTHCFNFQQNQKIICPVSICDMSLCYGEGQFSLNHNSI